MLSEGQKMRFSLKSLMPLSNPEDATLSLKDKDKVVVLGGGPAGCAAAMYLKKMKPSLDVIVLDNRNEKAMRTGGPGSCKGCVGGISGFMLDLLHYDFGIRVPKYLINNYIKGVKLVNILDNTDEKVIDIDFTKDLTGYWALPAIESILVSVGNGKGNYRHPEGKSISFDYFLRTKAKEMGAKFQYGYVNEILIPEHCDKNIIIQYSKKRLKSTLAWYKKDQIGNLTLRSDATLRTDQSIKDAALIINATGLNSRNRIRLCTYSDDKVIKELRKSTVTHRAVGKIMGIFDIDARREVLEKDFGHSIRVYGGIKGTNAIVAAPKYMQDGGSWLTVAILLDRDVAPQYDNLHDDDSCSTAKPQSYRHEMKAIRNEFLEKSGLKQYFENSGLSKISCRCTPIIPHEIARKPYGHRYIEIGDISGAMKYGRNGIPYAVVSAKRAIKAAVRYGIAEKNFGLHYDRKFVQPIRRDNKLGKYVVKLNAVINRYPILATIYYDALGHSPFIKRYAAQILLGVRRADNYTNSTLRLLKDTYGGIGLLAAIVKYYVKKKRKKATARRNGVISNH